MKKLLVYIFAPLLFMNALGIHVTDVCQLGSFIEHARYHNEQYGDDFFSFISKHYGKEKGSHQHPEEDSQQHDKLPFNHVEGAVNVLPAITPTCLSIVLTHITPNSVSISDYYKDGIELLFIADLWQPPQVYSLA